MEFKKINKFKEKNIPRYFLIIGLFVGTIMTLVMPIFNEPDARYHLAVSGKIVGINIDVSTYGETNISSGMKKQKEPYENGLDVVLKKYYFTKVKTTNYENLPRNIDYRYDYVFWGHIVPAIGVWIGYHVYSSLGVIIIFARLISMLFVIISMYFIIKRLKVGRLLFSAVTLSPVIINQSASLSYDATSYVITSYFLMLAINAIYERKFTKSTGKELIISTILIALFAKRNFYLLILLIPALILYCDNEIVFLNKIKEKVIKLWNWICSLRNSMKVLLGMGILTLAFALFTVMSMSYGGPIHVIMRMIRTFIFNNGGDGRDPSMGLLVAPYQEFNFVPKWEYGIWMVMMALILLSEMKFVNKISMSIFALLIFALNLFGVYYGFLSFDGATTGAISGAQGRYFTPMIPILLIFFGYDKFKLKINKNKYFMIGVFAIAVFSNFHLIFTTIYGLIKQ
ncbi:hypothetical protein BG261_07515 [Floricoccus tropicus]|uniref:DUF2142 domain-containing protein n=1 Tax=Floricoccus tropicus TaxID=1859473 RepID=A0A1E8GKF6_9LACT|nr:DUF2142 domain-containing protein [Floricoccus tropicus]OFI48731.1 hypothetical protein BG261_07515 [Floricoccus tropicus]